MSLPRFFSWLRFHQKGFIERTHLILTRRFIHFIHIQRDCYMCACSFFLSLLLNRGPRFSLKHVACVSRGERSGVEWKTRDFFAKRMKGKMGLVGMMWMNRAGYLLFCIVFSTFTWFLTCLSSVFRGIRER